jgi:hypothetical protein
MAATLDSLGRKLTTLIGVFLLIFAFLYSAFAQTFLEASILRIVFGIMGILGPLT